MEIIMRYLNTKTLRQETKSNANNIIDSDARVSNWFKPCPDGYFGEWVGETYSFTLIPPPTQAELDVKAEYDAQEYARNRASAYDSIGNQLDMIYKDNLNGTTTHKASVEAVKTKWPKNNTGPVE
jgi:hypothetical protein